MFNWKEIFYPTENILKAIKMTRGLQTDDREMMWKNSLRPLDPGVLSDQKNKKKERYVQYSRSLMFWDICLASTVTSKCPLKCITISLIVIYNKFCCLLGQTVSSVAGAKTEGIHLESEFGVWLTCKVLLAAGHLRSSKILKLDLGKTLLCLIWVSARTNLDAASVNFIHFSNGNHL